MVPRETLSPAHYFDLSKNWFSSIFTDGSEVWAPLHPEVKERWIRSTMKPNLNALRRQGSLVLETAKVPAGRGTAVIEAGSYVVGDEIELREGVTIEAGAWITGPTILGEGTAVRHGAYVRGGVLTGKKVIIGHASEVKSSIFFNEAKAPHFAYVGDSILGNRVNLGAGTKVSNLKLTNDEVVVRVDGQPHRTGLRKFGAIIGDETETGCNSVLNPGVLLGKKCLVYPAIAVRRNYYKAESIIR